MNLKERLALIKSEKNKLKPPSPRKRFVPEGWQEIAPLVWARDISWPFRQVPETLSPSIMRPFVPLCDGTLPAETGSVSAGHIAFFDLETTGLSGGAGTIAFLCTTASFEGSSLFLKQLYLEDYPGEPDFLKKVIENLSSAQWIASYNGTAFDMPLLHVRCVLNRITMPPLRHIDLLHDCRRFWGRSVESCALQSMEAFLLGKERESDIPGALVPRVWLDLVKSELPSEEQKHLMALVWKHNLEDVVSLAELFLLVEMAYRDPLSGVARYAIDPAAIAARLLKAGRAEEARELLLSVRDKNSAPGCKGENRMRALRVLASLARREKNRQLFAETILAMDNSAYGCVAKAKLFEHVYKDPQTALEWAKRAREEEPRTLPYLTIESLQHRIARLERKVARQKNL
jgi:hypothetical protein